MIAFNLACATAIAAGHTRARWATLRTRIIHVPARIAATGRRLVLHLPTHWPWASSWEFAVGERHRATYRDRHLTTQPATAQL